METKDNGLLSLIQLCPEPYKPSQSRIDKYEKRTGEKLDEVIKDFRYVKFFRDGGFTTFNIFNNYIEIGPTSCNWKDANDYLMMVANILSIPTLLTRTKRDYRAYIRLTKSTFVRMDGEFAIIEKDVN